MGKAYEDQDALRIRLNAHQNITGALATKMKYRKPDGTEGEWDGEPEDEENGIIYYDLLIDSKTIRGLWTWWLYVTFSDGRSAPGEPYSQYIYPEGY